MTRHSLLSLAVGLSLAAWLLAQGGAGVLQAGVLDKQKLLDPPDVLGQPRLGLVQGEHPVLRVPRRGHQHHLLLPLGAGHQAPDLRLAEQRLHVHRVHRPAVLVRGLRGDQLPGRAPALRGPLAARPAVRPRLRPLLVPHARAPQPRRYSTWLADAVWAVHQVHPDDAFVKDLLPDLVKNYEGWEKRALRPGGRPVLADRARRRHGVSTSTAGRPRTPSAARPATGRRSTLPVGRRPGHRPRRRPGRRQGDRATRTATKAAALKENLQKKLWDPKRQFFFPMAKQDEEADGHTVKARLAHAPDRPATPAARTAAS